MQFVLSFFLAFFLLCQSGFAADYVTGKHIWIWQSLQIGEAVEDGELIYIFRIITGRADRYRTREGDFRIYQKSAQHVNHEGIPMPYSMFFDARRALHGWSWEEPFPSDEERPYLASHGCVSTEIPQELFEWAPLGTSVHVRGERTGYY
jgi:hypothetical protein